MRRAAETLALVVLVFAVGGACRAADSAPPPDSALAALAQSRLPDVCTGADTSMHGRDDTPRLRAAAASRYAHAYPIRELMTGTSDSMAVMLPPERRGEFIRLMDSSIDYSVLSVIMCNAIAKHYTPEEIDAMHTFFGSPAGRSAMKKFAPYMSDLMPGTMLEMQRARARVLSSLK